jgi:hypothetical protein
VADGKAALNTADNISKLSQKNGISVESSSLAKPIAELHAELQKQATAMVGGSEEQIEASAVWEYRSRMPPDNCVRPRNSCSIWPMPLPTCMMARDNQHWRDT